MAWIRGVIATLKSPIGDEIQINNYWRLKIINNQNI